MRVSPQVYWVVMTLYRLVHIEKRASLHPVHGQIGRPTDGQTDRRTHTHTDTSISGDLLQFRAMFRLWQPS